MADVTTQANELPVCLAFTALCLSWQDTFLFCELFLGRQYLFTPYTAPTTDQRKDFSEV